MTARLYARAAGLLLAPLGAAGLFSGGFPLFEVLNVDSFENLFHLAPGFALLYASFAPRGERLAGVVSLATGVLYALVGVVAVSIGASLYKTRGAISNP